MVETTLLLTLPDICHLSGLSWWAAYRRARAGTWKGRLEPIAGRQTWVFERASVLRWVKKQQSARPARAERSEHHHDGERRRVPAA